MTKEEKRIEKVIDHFVEKSSQDVNDFMSAFKVLLDEFKPNAQTEEALTHLINKETNIHRKAIYEILLNSVEDMLEETREKLK